MKCGVWRLPDPTNPSEQSEVIHSHQQQDLQLAWKFDKYLPPSFSDNCQCIDWHPTKTGRIATIHTSQFFIWDLEDGGSGGGEPKLNCSSAPKSKDDEEMYMGKWNPHLDGNQLATVSSTSVKGYDLRSMNECWNISLAHKFQVRDVDFNPNKQYYMATCGDDCAVRFWDVRNNKEAIKEVKAHSHW